MRRKQLNAVLIFVLLAGCGSGKVTGTSGDGGGNAVIPPFTVSAGCDMAVLSVSAPDTIAAGATASISYVLANAGTTCAPQLYSSAIMSHDGGWRLGGGLIGTDYVLSPPTSGKTLIRTVDVEIPADSPAGTYDIRVQQNHQDDLAGDDAASTSVQIQSSYVCQDDAYEPDNDKTTAPWAELGVTQSRNFCFDDVDLVRLDADGAHTYVIDAMYTGTLTRPRVDVNDEVTNAMPHSTTTDLLTITPAAGVYDVAIWRGAGGPPIDAPYTLTITATAL